MRIIVEEIREFQDYRARLAGQVPIFPFLGFPTCFSRLSNITRYQTELLYTNITH